MATDGRYIDRGVTLSAAELDVLNTKGEIPSLAGETTGSGTYIGYQLMSGMDYQLHCLVSGFNIAAFNLAVILLRQKNIFLVAESP